jgi:DNA excision repair protein ERCC-3
VALPEAMRMDYAVAGAKTKFRLASENEAKIGVARAVLKMHAGDQAMVIGPYLDPLVAMAREFDAPIITGKTPNDERAALYDDFKSGRIPLIIVSKVANFAVDLPTASVAVQVSGTFGSRQEEAQRLGRILRPKTDGSAAVFYSVVTLGSRDQEFAEKRQLFLTEQGYTYQILEAEQLGATLEPGARK